MSFDAPVYYLFLVCVVALYWRLSRTNQNHLLLLASYLFYGWWNWRFLSLILFSTLVDYLLGQQIHNARQLRTRRLFMIGSVIMNLGVLAFFKYANFFVDSFVSGAHELGFHPSARVLSIILPIGISFYTFQSMTYVIDIYRRKISPYPTLKDFALFIAFFPQLVAGPIMRTQVFRPQLERDRTFRKRRFWHGTELILWGLVKKVVVADNVGYYVDSIFNLKDPSTLLIMLGTIGFAIQIYCDFSGYIDIARGSANLVGFHLPRNFRRPYLAISIADFWRRWHITLSMWIRDYLYFPLGGSRCSPMRNAFNILLTWTLCGLWHGANMRFIAWGFYFGVLILIQRNRHFPASRISGIISTTALVLIGWLMFRTPSFNSVPAFFSVDALLASLADGTIALALVAVCSFYCLPLVAMGAWSYVRSRSALSFSQLVHARTLMALAAFILIFFIGKLHSSDFIYFQF